MGERIEGLVGDVAFQAPDDVALGQPLGSVTSEVSHGAGLVCPHTHQHDPMPS